MNLSDFRFTLDIHETRSQKLFTVRRWDTGRALVITLAEHGVPYVIAPDCHAEIIFYKPDGSILRSSCQIDGDTIQYEFTKRTTSLTGQVLCEVRLLDSMERLLTSPKFEITVYSTIYNYGDATESEIINANTVKSANPGYSEVAMWSDGNPNNEDRTGYFVCFDTSRSAAMVRKCDGNTDINGVSMMAPGFSSNAPRDKFDNNSALLPQFCYVGFLGFAPIIDNGTCTVNGRCKSAADGTAIPDDSGGGFLVVERIDEKHVLLFLEQSADMINKLSKIITDRIKAIGYHLTARIGTQWEGTQAPFSQTVSVPGMLETDKPVYDVLLSDDYETSLKEEEAFGYMFDLIPQKDKVIIKSHEKTEVDVTIQLEVARYE